MSASRIPTLRPAAARATARLAVTVDLPTPLFRRHHVERERHLGDAFERADLPLHLLVEARAQRAARDRQGDRDGDAAVVDLDAAHHVELRDRTPELRVDDVRERLANRFTTGHTPRVPKPGSVNDRTSLRYAARLHRACAGAP